MKTLLLALLLAVQGAAADTLAVESLFEQKSRIPTVLIPLKIKGDAIDAGGTVFDVAVSATNDADCRVMKDPFVANVHLLKCLSESDVTLTFKVAQGGKIHQLVYGPLHVKLPEGDFKIVPPKPGAEDILAGTQIYNVYCISCHNPPRLKAGRTAAQIRGALGSQPEMKPFNSSLSDADLKKIEAYLKSL
jgi:hypothetical protein